MATTANELAGKFEYRERTLTLSLTPIEIVKEDFSRVAFRFQLAVVTILNPVTGEQVRVSTRNAVTAVSGFPVTFSTPLDLFFNVHGPIVGEAWYGVIAVGTGIITILETFYKPWQGVQDGR